METGLTGILRRVSAIALVLPLGACNPLPGDEPERTDQHLMDRSSGGGTSDTAQDDMKRRQEDEKKRETYLAAKYPGERGQSPDLRKTLYAAVIDVYNTAVNDKFPPYDGLVPGSFSSEHVTALYRDKYGYNYYWAPKRGIYDPDTNTWDTGWRWPDDFPKRPELEGAWGTVHNHVRGRGAESPVDGNGQNPLPNWVVLDDGSIWVYTANTVKAKPFGSIKNGQVITAYNTLDDAINPNVDVYANGDSGGCGFWCWAGIVLGASSTGTLATVALVGLASTTGESCCFGPPATGYDPNADPTQICRHPDGNGDCS